MDEVLSQKEIDKLLADLLSNNSNNNEKDEEN